MDEVTRVRLRRLLVGYLGEFATLDLHLDLLDARGAWYAEASLAAWTRSNPGAFFGLVRHVVRTQLGGPAPVPDIEGWLAAGVPSGDLLAQRWNTLNTLRYPRPRWLPATPRTQTGVPASVTHLDAVIGAWPEDLFDEFVLAYAKVTQVLERRRVPLPPITQ